MSESSLPRLHPVQHSLVPWPAPALCSHHFLCLEPCCLVSAESFLALGAQFQSCALWEAFLTAPVLPACFLPPGMLQPQRSELPLLPLVFTAAIYLAASKSWAPHRMLDGLKSLQSICGIISQTPILHMRQCSVRFPRYHVVEPGLELGFVIAATLGPRWGVSSRGTY